MKPAKMSKPARVQALYLALLSITVLVCMWARPRESGFSSTSIAPPPPEAPPVVAAIPPPPEAFAPLPWLPPPPEALAPPPWPFFEWWGGAGGDPCGRAGLRRALRRVGMRAAGRTTACRCRIGGDGMASVRGRGRSAPARHHRAAPQDGRRSPYDAARAPRALPGRRLPLRMVDAAAAADAPADFLYHVGLDGAGLPGHGGCAARRAPIPALLRGPRPPRGSSTLCATRSNSSSRRICTTSRRRPGAGGSTSPHLRAAAVRARKPRVVARGAAPSAAAAGARPRAARSRRTSRRWPRSRAPACRNPRYLQLDIAELGRDLDGALRQLARFVADAAGRGADAPVGVASRAGGNSLGVAACGRPVTEGKPTGRRATWRTRPRAAAKFGARRRRGGTTKGGKFRWVGRRRLRQWAGRGRLCGGASEGGCAAAVGTPRRGFSVRVPTTSVAYVCGGSAPAGGARRGCASTARFDERGPPRRPLGRAARPARAPVGLAAPPPRRARPRRRRAGAGPGASRARPPRRVRRARLRRPPSGCSRPGVACPASARRARLALLRRQGGGRAHPPAAARRDRVVLLLRVRGLRDLVVLRGRRGRAAAARGARRRRPRRRAPWGGRPARRGATAARPPGAGARALSISACALTNAAVARPPAARRRSPTPGSRLRSRRRRARRRAGRAAAAEDGRGGGRAVRRRSRRAARPAARRRRAGVGADVGRGVGRAGAGAARPRAGGAVARPRAGRRTSCEMVSGARKGPSARSRAGRARRAAAGRVVALAQRARGASARSTSQRASCSTKPGLGHAMRRRSAVYGARRRARRRRP